MRRRRFHDKAQPTASEMDLDPMSINKVVLVVAAAVIGSTTFAQPQELPQTQMGAAAVVMGQ